MIVVIDYGLGNGGSIMNLLDRLGIAAVFSRDPGEVGAARKLILPGVGAFDAGMTSLDARGLVAPIRNAVISNGAALLGICLGMQLLSQGSEEGELPGLGLVRGRCVRFKPAREGGLAKIPHMGWSSVDVVRPCRLFPTSEEERRFYFVHSYHLVCDDLEDVVAIVRGEATFTAAVERGAVFGCQFHPEKSHRFGMALMRSFAELAV